MLILAQPQYDEVYEKCDPRSGRETPELLNAAPHRLLSGVWGLELAWRSPHLTAERVRCKCSQAPQFPPRFSLQASFILRYLRAGAAGAAPLRGRRESLGRTFPHLPRMVQLLVPGSRPARQQPANPPAPPPPRTPPPPPRRTQGSPGEWEGESGKFWGGMAAAGARRRRERR